MDTFAPFELSGQIRHWPRDRFWTQPLNSHVLVVNRPPFREFYVGHILVQRVSLDREAEERLALVMLLESGAISEQSLARQYGYHYNTLCNWRRRYRQYGFDGLKRGNLADLEPHSAGPKQLSQPEQLCFDLPPAELADTETQCSDGALADQTAVLKLETVPVVDDAPCASAVVNEVTEEQRWSRYAGVLLCLPFANSLLAPIFTYVQARETEFHSDQKRWRIGQFLRALVFYFLLGIPNIEQTKALHHQEIGVIFRCSRGPSCRTLRRDLAQLTAADLPSVLRRELALQLIRLGWVEVGTLSIDGHFVPYYGQGNIPKGYFPQRREAHKGHFQHWVHDRRGRPLLVLHHQAFSYFPEAILALLDEIQTLLSEAGSAEPLVLAFDRGAYDAKFFRELDAHNVGFITWRRHSPTFDEALYTQTLSVPGSKPEQFQHVPYHLTRYPVKGYRQDVYTLSLLDREEHRQNAIITNVDRLFPDRYRPEDLLLALRHRWRQENAFKSGKAKEGIDQMGHYDLVDLADDRTVSNPRLAFLRRRIREVERHLGKCQRLEQAMRAAYDKLKRKPSWPRYLQQKKNQRTLERKQALETTLTQLQAELTQTPRQISYKELHGDDAQVIRLDRSSALTTLRIAACHVRLQLTDLAAQFFTDHRERTKFVESLLHAGGYYQQQGDHDVVTLVPPATPVYRRAAEQLVAALTALNPQAADGSGRRVIFRLENTSPTKV